MTTLFVSDLHLCPTRPVLTGLFFDFLAKSMSTADHLYILGDLFEYWIGDDALSDPFNASVCTALRNCPTPISLIVGNRDFLIGEAFCTNSGVRLLPEETVIDIEGTPTLLLHGDTLCTDDVEYQRFRHQVRSSTWQAEFLAQTLAQRNAIVERMRSQSKQQKQEKSMALMDVNEETVQQAFRTHQVKQMVHGHTHRLNTHQHVVDGQPCTRYVLGDWEELPRGGNFLACHQGQWQRHTWPNGQVCFQKKD